jgi:hypothetical protein
MLLPFFFFVTDSLCMVISLSRIHAGRIPAAAIGAFTIGTSGRDGLRLVGYFDVPDELPGAWLSLAPLPQVAMPLKFWPDGFSPNFVRNAEGVLKMPNPNHPSVTTADSPSQG